MDGISVIAALLSVIAASQAWRASKKVEEATDALERVLSNFSVPHDAVSSRFRSYSALANSIHNSSLDSPTNFPPSTSPSQSQISPPIDSLYSARQQPPSIYKNKFNSPGFSIPSSGSSTNVPYSTPSSQNQTFSGSSYSSSQPPHDPASSNNSNQQEIKDRQRIAEIESIASRSIGWDDPSRLKRFVDSEKAQRPGKKEVWYYERVYEMYLRDRT